MPGRQLFLEQGSEPGDWDGRPAPGLPVGSTQPGQAHLLHQQTQIGGRRPRRHAVGCPAGHSSCELYHVWVWWGCTGCSSSCYHGHYPVENTANSDRTSGPRVHTGNTGQAPLCQVTSPASAAWLCYSAVMQLRQQLALWLTYFPGCGSVFVEFLKLPALGRCPVSSMLLPLFQGSLHPPRHSLARIRGVGPISGT